MPLSTEDFEEIVQLRERGLTYSAIAQQTGISVNRLSYYLGEDQGKKAKARVKRHRLDNSLKHRVESYTTLMNENKRRAIKSLKARIEQFKSIKERGMRDFHYFDVIQKFTKTPKCYLTGEQLDLDNPSTYQLDHKLPLSRGGKSDLDNLGILSPRANMAKSDLTPEEFIDFCKQVLTYQGYQVNKP